jgi:hypothetical protein
MGVSGEHQQMVVRDRANEGESVQLEPSPTPGEGPTVTVSASLRQGTVEAVRSRAGQRGFSRYVEEAVIRRIARENLREVLDDMEQANGPAYRTAVDEKRAFLRGEASRGQASGPAA